MFRQTNVLLDQCSVDESALDESVVNENVVSRWNYDKYVEFEY